MREKSGPQFNPIARLQTKDGICEYLGGISHATYDQWQARGLVPGPVSGTTRYDLKQHDHVLDKTANLTGARKMSPLEAWEAENARAA